MPPSVDGNGFSGEYQSDFEQLAELGLTHHRLSLDWARLEPYEGRHDADEIDRYRDLLRAAGDAGLSIWVCLHHVTLPGWFADDLGGFVDWRGREYHWAKHVDFVAETFGDLVAGWIPVHDPLGFASRGWLTASRPPGRRDPEAFSEVLEATHLAAHVAWKLLRSGDQPVATSHDVRPLHPVDASPETARALTIADELAWRCWTRAMTDGVLQIPGRSPIEDESFIGAYDLVGFTYRGASIVGVDGTTIPYPADAPRLNPLGDAAFPDGLRHCIERLAHDLAGRDLLVAGCGWVTDPAADAEDDWRVEYLTSCLGLVDEAVADGYPLRGFFHDTAVDSYEWEHGFGVRNGLIDRDRNPKPSAELAGHRARAQ